MRDVAKATGFSPATVSIVLNNAPLARYIASNTKKKIEETAKRLGYRPNAMAAFCAASEAKASALMLTDVMDPFCTPILRGIEKRSLPPRVPSDFLRRPQPARTIRALPGNVARAAMWTA